jgi:hypothetical protein
MRQRLMSEKPSKFPATRPDGEFGIPEEDEVVALLAVGRAEKHEKTYPGRFPVEQIVFSERYGEAWRRGR